MSLNFQLKKRLDNNFIFEINNLTLIFYKIYSGFFILL